MATYNGTALDIVNAVSLKVSGIPADSLARPTKAEILAEVNEVTRQALGRKNWNFLFASAKVQNYESLRNSQFYVNPSMGGSLASHSTGIAGQTDMYGIDITNQGAALGEVWTLASAMPTIQVGGIGSIYGTLTAMVCKDVNGVPDVANPIATASYTIVDNLIVNYNGSSLDLSGFVSPVFTFTQASVDDVIVAPAKGYLVFKMAYSSGSTTYLNFLCGQGVTTALININGAGWERKQSVNITARVDLNYSTFIVNKEGIISLPADVSDLMMVYVGTYAAPTETIGRVMSTEVMLDKGSQPYATYYFYDVDSGIKRIYIKTTISNATSFNLVYKKQPALLVNDADLSDIPANFRDILVYKATYNFLSRGYGEQDANNLQSLMLDYEKGMIAMKEECLPRKISGFSVNIGGYTPTGEVNTYEPNSWSQGIPPIVYDKRSI
jgi:hypothetical protein